jgi:hypothetical protein
MQNCNFIYVSYTCESWSLVIVALVNAYLYIYIYIYIYIIIYKHIS